MSFTQVYLKTHCRIFVSDLTKVAQEAITRHETTPLVSLVLSTAIAVLAPIAKLKNHGRISATLKTDGPLKTVIVEATAHGDVRALVSNAQIYTEHDAASYNFLPLKIALGNGGTLKIVHEQADESFGGEVNLVKNDIVTDTAFYFAQSEQIYTAIVADVHLSSPSTLARAYGVIFQMLPGHSEVDVLWVENFIKTHKLSALGLARYTAALEARRIDEQAWAWKCTCSQARMRELINLLDEAEQQAILKAEGKIEVTCNFCNTKYILRVAD